MTVAKAETGRLDLHEALLRRPFDHGVICTYVFDPFFFEKECLDKLRAISHNGNLSVLVDRGAYDDIVERSGADRPTQANVRYLLHPVAARGVFHPKIFLFASRGRGRLILGSANFTAGGLYRNAELVGSFDYEAEEDETFGPLFRSAFAFLTRLAEKYPGEALGWKLRWMSEEAPWLLPAEEPAAPRDDFELLDNLDAPLWEQLASRVAGPVETLSVVSRYFDKSPAILDRLYERLKPKKIRVYTQNNTTSLTKEYLGHPLVKAGTAEVLLCDYTDEGQHQDLHAKGIAVETGREVLFAYGSANCTSPALLRAADAGNVEILLLLKGLTRRTLKPEKLFDPGDTAVRLKDASALRTEAREEASKPPHPLIRLAEANVAEKLLRLRLSFPESLAHARLVATLALPDESKHALPLGRVSEEVYAGELSEELLQKLSEVTSVARAEAHDGGEVVATSNGVFAVHLQDITTGRSLRRERSLREAQQSPARFVEVFGAYLEGGDEEATRNFLDSFNVRVTDIPVPVMYRAVRPVWETERAFMAIRGRPWAISDTVHEAVLKFFERHHKRLLRHVENRSPEGIPNFLHILLTTDAVLHGQIGHGVAGLRERSGAPLPPEEWSRQRDKLASYFARHRELLACLAKQYLAPMSRRYPAAKIREQLAPEAEMLRSLAARVISLRNELEALRVGRLRVESTPGRVRVAPLFPSSLFHESQWPRYERDVAAAQATVEAFLS